MVNTSFTVKLPRIEDPKSYLGYYVGKLYYEDGLYTWKMVSKTYLEKAINNLKKNIKADGFIFNKKLFDVNYSPNQPFSITYYYPDLDNPVKCSKKQVTI